MGYIFIRINTFTFMLTCAQAQFKRSSRKIEQQVKQHEVRTNKLSSVNTCLKKSVVFFKKKPRLVQHIISFFPVNTEYVKNISGSL